MQILDRRTIVERAEIINPDNTEFETGIFDAPFAYIGFTIDRDHEEDVMVFGIHLEYQIEYSPTIKYDFECFIIPVSD